MDSVYRELTADARRLVESHHVPDGATALTHLVIDADPAREPALSYPAMVRLLFTHVHETRTATTRDMRARARNSHATERMHGDSSACTAATLTLHVLFKPLMLELLVPWVLAHGATATDAVTPHEREVLQSARARFASLVRDSFTIDGPARHTDGEFQHAVGEFYAHIGVERMRELCYASVPHYELLVEADTALRAHIQAVAELGNRVCAACGARAPTMRCPCHTVSYCGKMCQQNDWHAHKAAHRRHVAAAGAS